MMTLEARSPRRILIVDDNPAIHEDFRKVLCPVARPSDELRGAAAALFGRPVDGPATTTYQVDVASRGQDGLARVRESMAEQQPYMLAFVDMRMPNGWNGIETTRQIWAINPLLQIVICTAFSDYSWDEIRSELPQ
ncbi:MAG: response regulator, partial [Rhodoferax sp.]|nr:response regulator [Rhodoferax sp.]